jgi:hypothetical protein
VKLLIVAVLAVLATACASLGFDDGSPEPAGVPVPADGICRAGVVVQAGESCKHEYAYRTGTRISAAGTQPIIQFASIVFRVDSDGQGHYGDDFSGTNLTRTITIGERMIRFVAYDRGDGSFYIEAATGLEAAGEAAGQAPTCVVGMTLAAGERCAPAGGGLFTVEADGDGCLESSICAGRSINIPGFSAEKSGGVWTITGLQ